jgi:hypothetical protein
MKPVVTVLSSGERDKEDMVGMNITKAYCKHIQNVTMNIPVQLLIYANKNIKSNYWFRD